VRPTRRVSSNRWAAFRVNHAAFTDLETVDVRVVVNDHGPVVFDATRLVQLDESQPNGAGCDPTLFNPVSRRRPKATDTAVDAASGKPAPHGEPAV
jgi:hypothetical protein